MRQKRILTRRQKTLRRGAVMAVLLALVVFMGDYGFTPRYAIRMAEESVDCGKTEVVQKLGAAPVEHTPWNRLYVSANERAVLFTSAEYHFSHGWEDRDGGCVDCVEDTPVHGAIYKLTSTWTEEATPDDPTGRKYDEVWYLYGRVDDPRGVSIQGAITYSEEWDGEISGIWAEQTSSREEWVRKGGYSYFVFPLYTRTDWKQGDGPEGGRFYFQLKLLDAEGNVLYEDQDLGGTGTTMSK